MTFSAACSALVATTQTACDFSAAFLVLGLRFERFNFYAIALEDEGQLNNKEQQMLENNVSDPMTDQEIAFAQLVLSGTMTDRRAADVVGLNPGTTAYTKAKSRVSDYMHEH
jgi:hypothetical protein